MNNPTVKLDLDSIINVDLVYEQNLPVRYSCLLCSIVFASFHVALFMTSLILTNLIATFVPVAKTMASDPEG